MNSEPFSFSDAFGRSIQVYADHFLFLGLLSFGSFVLPLWDILFNQLIFGDSTDINIMLVPLEFGMYVLFTILLLEAQVRFFKGEKVLFKDVLLVSWPRIWRALGGFALFFLVGFAGAFFLIVPALWWITVFHFFIFAQVVENRKIWDSFGRSKELVQGEFFNVFKAHAIMLLIAIVLFAPMVLGMLLLWTPPPIMLVALLLASGIVLPFFTGFYYQLYGHLCRRKDGRFKIHETLVPGHKA